MWIIDFGWTMNESEAALYESPFAAFFEKVKPVRDGNRRAGTAITGGGMSNRPAMWAHWQLKPSGCGRGDPGAVPDRDAGLMKARRSCYIATPSVAKHRLFVWLHVVFVRITRLLLSPATTTRPSASCIRAFTKPGRCGSVLLAWKIPAYTPTTTFETFPFPEGLTPNVPAADYADDPRAQRIAAAAKKLDDLRRAWLNPPDLVDIVPEVTPTAAPGEAPMRYPDRIVPKTVEAAVKLKERTLTNLYNQRPRWLADAHDALDRAVAAAYGWPEDIATEDALARLLALNLERSKRETLTS